jgi:hypothetical protein
MGSTDWLSFSYAGVVAAGGLMGYLKAGEQTNSCVFSFQKDW